MTTLSRSLHASLLALVVSACVVATSARAEQILVNGGFESGLAGWTRVDQTGSDGAFLSQTGTGSPANDFPVPPPPQGEGAAMTDSGGPGSHVLYQDFVVASTTESATLSFRLFIANYAEIFASPDSLDFSMDANQQARVDLLAGSSDPFSVAAGDVLLNAFRTMPGDPIRLGYVTLTFDVTELLNAHVGETLRLRFAEVDNLFFFNFGVDDVRLVIGERVTVPEAPTAWLLLAGFAALATTVRRREARRPLRQVR